MYNHSGNITCMDVVVTKTGDRMITIFVPNVFVPPVEVPFRKAEKDAEGNPFPPDANVWYNVGPLQFAPFEYSCQVMVLCLLVGQGLSAVQFEEPVAVEAGSSIRIEANQLAVLLPV